jgi:hypothetical protein
MPKLTRDFPVTIGFRTTESDAKKLAELAEQTCRGQGEVLRLLLKQAVLADAPHIQLVGPLSVAMSIAEVDEGQHVG